MDEETRKKMIEEIAPRETPFEKALKDFWNAPPVMQRFIDRRKAMEQIDKDKSKRHGLINAVYDALQGRQVIFVCPPGERDATHEVVKAILGPIPFPKDRLRIMPGKEEKDDAS